MANRIKNRITFMGEKEEIKKIVNMYKSIDVEDREYFDFNKIVPMPEVLDVISSSDWDLALYLYITINDLNYDVLKTKGDYLSKFNEKRISNIRQAIIKKGYNPDDKLSLKKYAKNYRNVYVSDILMYGRNLYKNLINYDYKDWYDWRCDKWGTKCNSFYNIFSEDDNIIEFETAWAVPIPIIKEFIKLHPDILFEWCFANEDARAGMGIITNKDGEINIENIQFTGKSISKKFYNDLWKIV